MAAKQETFIVPIDSALAERIASLRRGTRKLLAEDIKTAIENRVAVLQKACG